MPVFHVQKILIGGTTALDARAAGAGDMAAALQRIEDRAGFFGERMCFGHNASGCRRASAWH